jgi:predicted ATPase
VLKEPLEGKRCRDIDGRFTPSSAPEALEGGERDNLCMTSRLASPDLVGRQRELTEFETRLESVGQSSGATILVGGEAGIGKTRLIVEASRRARASGYLTAVGACMSADGRALPHAAVVGLLRDLERQLEDQLEALGLAPAMEAVGMSRARAEVSLTVQRARRVLSDSAHTAGAHQIAKTLTYEVIARALADLSRSIPLMVAFEDMHWADTFTLGLLDYLSRNLGPYPILLVASYRSDELADQDPLRQLVAELLRIHHVVRMELGGLEGEELEALMAGILGHRPRRALVETTTARTAGNPFFVEELLTAGVDDVPDDLLEVVVARVRRLAEPCRRLLDVAAVIGSRIEHRLLADVSDMGAVDLDGAIAEGVGAHLLVVEDGGRGYRFRHDLVREAVYGSLLPGERARLHHRVATALAVRPELVPKEPGWLEAELAFHWWEAGVWTEALPACAAAAAAEAEMFAFADAKLNLTRAILAWDRLGDDTASSVVPVDRAALLEQAADAAFFADSLPQALDVVPIDLADRVHP